MQLDQTQIVIRARSLSEIGDLALRVIHRFPAATILGGLLGALPWAVANAALIGWIVVEEWWIGLDDEESVGALARYCFLMISLVVLQAPIAGSLTTIWIARAVFEPNVGWRDALADWRRRFWATLWPLGVVRGPLPLMLALAIGWREPFDYARELFLPLGCLAWAGFLRGRRPFLPEILLLERCPRKSRDPGVITVKLRNRALHDPLTGELTARFLVVSAVLLLLAFGMVLALGWVRGVLFGQWESSLLMNLVVYPAMLWLIASISVVVRFLGYLDSRIRLEGWEVDLAVRAEADRLAGNSDTRRLLPGKTAVVTAGVVLLAIGCGWFTAGPAWSQSAIDHAQAAQRELGSEGGSVTEYDARGRSDVTESVANDPVVLPPSGNWFDRSSGEVVPIRLSRRDGDASNRASDWTSQTDSSGSGWFRWNWGSGSWSFAPWFRVLGWVLLILVSFGFAMLLMYLFARIEPAAAGWRGPGLSMGNGVAVDDQTFSRMAELPAELRIRALDLRAEVERAMAAGRWEQAILALFGHQLILLDRHGWLRLARGKTNGRYLQESSVHSKDARGILAGTVEAFEASYFGRRPPTAERFAELWQANVELERLTHQQQAAGS